MKINNFQGDLTDISAKKEALNAVGKSKGSDLRFFWDKNASEGFLKMQGLKQDVNADIKRGG